MAKSSGKQIQIDKAQATMVGVIAGAVFVAIFSIVSSQALWKQRGYQGRVIEKKQIARDQLDENVDSVKDLVSSYQRFVSAPVNMLEGNPTGSGDRDGDNARLVLDALPSKYDFPALTASLEKILTDRNLKVSGISGTDDEISQSSVGESGSPQSVEVPFQVSIDGSYSSVQELISVFERSIRPFHVTAFSLGGGANNMQLSLSMKTYFQSEKTLNIEKVTVQ